MEDALAHSSDRMIKQKLGSLNPCCNGRCTRTIGFENFKDAEEMGLNPCCNGRCTRTF